jgi:uncharacterized protein YtpQ (UPF0354 family)
MSEVNREQFVQKVIDVAKGRFPAAKIARADQPFSLRINGQVASLENVYRSSMLQPDQSVSLIEGWMLEVIRASEGTPDHKAGFDELAERIMPVVLREENVDSQPALMVSQPLVAGLSIAYAIDGEKSFWYIPKSTLDGWKLSIDDLHERALTNLVDRSQAIAAQAAQDPDGRISLILFQTGDGYDASRLLLPTLHERLREHLGSPFMAGIPNRDILLCFRGDDETRDRLRAQIHKDYGQMPHPITDRLLLITQDGIAPGE